jgi:hypothetical protein
MPKRAFCHHQVVRLVMIALHHEPGETQPSDFGDVCRR